MKFNNSNIVLTVDRLSKQFGGEWVSEGNGRWSCKDGKATARCVCMCSHDDICNCARPIFVYGCGIPRRLV